MNNYAKQICDQLYKLTAIASPSGYTAKAAKYVKETLDNMGYEARITRKDYFRLSWNKKRKR